MYPLDRQSAVELTTISDPSADFPTWSPDGQWIAARFDGYQLVLINILTGDRRYIGTQFTHVYRILGWSSDSKYIVVVARQPGMSQATSIVDISGAVVGAFTESPNVHHIVWTTSNRIYYFDPSFTNILFEYDLDSGRTLGRAINLGSGEIVAFQSIPGTPELQILVASEEASIYDLYTVLPESLVTMHRGNFRVLDLLDRSTQVTFRSSTESLSLIYPVGRFPFSQLAEFSLESGKFRVITDGKCDATTLSMHSYTD